MTDIYIIVGFTLVVLFGLFLLCKVYDLPRIFISRHKKDKEEDDDD